jgi:hypothetical protein
MTYADALSKVNWQGKPGEIAQGFAGIWNSLAPKNAQISGLDEAELVDKGSVLAADLRSREGGQTAARALETYMNANPNNRQTPEARSKLMASLLVASREMMDQGGHLKKWEDAIGSEMRGQQGVFRAEDAQRNFRETYTANRYYEEANTLTKMMLLKNEETGVPVFSQYLNFASQVLREGDPDRIRETAEIIDKNFGPGMHRYFLGEIL